MQTTIKSRNRYHMMATKPMTPMRELTKFFLPPPETLMEAGAGLLCELTRTVDKVVLVSVGILVAGPATVDLVTVMSVVPGITAVPVMVCVPGFNVIV